MVDEGPNPLITTIIPTYRRPKFLRRAIRSVLNQSFTNFQVCVYDNASGDETPSVVADIARSDRRVKYHCHPENIGAIRNFLYGMERIETPFFSFLSDDDFLLPDFYETALQGLGQYPVAMFSASAVVLLDQQKRISAIPVWNWTPGRDSTHAGV
jgi:glycosyltransferase involved in cell wall biosynthesis